MSSYSGWIIRHIYATCDILFRWFMSSGGDRRKDRIYALTFSFLFVVFIAVFWLGFDLRAIAGNILSSLATILGLYILLEYFRDRRIRGSEV